MDRPDPRIAPDPGSRWPIYVTWLTVLAGIAALTPLIGAPIAIIAMGTYIPLALAPLNRWFYAFCVAGYALACTGLYYHAFWLRDDFGERLTFLVVLPLQYGGVLLFLPFAHGLDRLLTKSRL